MSVIVRNNPSVGVGGSTSKGFPPGDIKLVEYKSSHLVQIKWQDPDDTIIDGITIAKWKGTLLIRNSDHYPTSIKDGDIVIDNIERNKYKDTYYEDSNLNVGAHYYRFFTYSDENVYNDSGDLVFKANTISYKSVFANNTWEEIDIAVRSNAIPDTWKVGDEKELTLSGEIKDTIILQIWDFNYFDKSDGSGKAGILLGAKNLLNKRTSYGVDMNGLGWKYLGLKYYTNNNIFKSMPIELQNIIKEVNTYSGSDLSKDKVFIGSNDEIRGGFLYFSAQSEYGAKIEESDEYYNGYWTRNVSWDGSKTYGFFISRDIGSKFTSVGTMPVTDENYVRFCFNI